MFRNIGSSQSFFRMAGLPSSPYKCGVFEHRGLAHLLTIQLSPVSSVSEIDLGLGDHITHACFLSGKLRLRSSSPQGNLPNNELTVERAATNKRQLRPVRPSRFLFLVFGFRNSVGMPRSQPRKIQSQNCLNIQFVLLANEDGLVRVVLKT